MPRSRSLVRLSRSEWALMMHLWRAGPATAHQLLDLASAERIRGYTTILTFLARMEEKGYITVDRAQKTHVYEAAIPFAQAMAEESAYILKDHLQGDPEAVKILSGEIAKHLAVSQRSSPSRRAGPRAPRKPKKDSGR